MQRSAAAPRGLTVARRLPVVLLTFLTVGATGAVAAPAPPVATSSKASLMISDALTTGAPQDGRGGVFGPYVDCGNPGLEVRSAKSTVTNMGTGSSKTYRWDFSGPNPFVHRGPAGKYEVDTTLRCPGGATRKRVQVVRIVQKRPATTMSRAEFASITRGMSRARVTRIVGYRGRSGGTYAGRQTRIYDSMPFWSLSSVTFRDGRVVGKQYDFDHD